MVHVFSYGLKLMLEPLALLETDQAGGQGVDHETTMTWLVWERNKTIPLCRWRQRNSLPFMS